jgi:hypothetical protein
MINLIQLGPNFTIVHIGKTAIWFSYETPIAMRSNNMDIYAVENSTYTRTTAKHLNRIGGIKERVSVEELNNLIKKALEEK